MFQPKNSQLPLTLEVRLGDCVGTAIYEVPVNFEAPQVDPSPPPENLSASASINETTFMDIIHVSSDRVLSLTGTGWKEPIMRRG